MFWLIMATTAILWAPVSLLTWPLPFKQRYSVVSQWARFNLWCLALICKLRYEVEGRENIPAGTGIIFCKHQSTWETLALQCIFPPHTWVLKRELLRIPFFGWGLAVLDPVAIDRGAGSKALRQLVDQGTERLQAGTWLVIFPEGTRVAPGYRRRFFSGGAMLAQKSGFPVVPVAHNAGEFWPRHGFLKRPGVIRLVIGAPITTDGRKSSEINAAAEQWIAETMTRITGKPEQVLQENANA